MGIRAYHRLPRAPLLLGERFADGTPENRCASSSKTVEPGGAQPLPHHDAFSAAVQQRLPSGLLQAP